MPMDWKDKKHIFESEEDVKVYNRKKKEEPIHKNKNFLASFEFALQGFKTVFQEERNMRKHVVVAILAICASLFFRLNAREWLWVLAVIFLVIVVEIVNTCFENMVDMVTDYHFHPIGKKVKDMAAAAVLFTAFFALVVGSIIFLPKVLAFLNNILS